MSPAVRAALGGVSLSALRPGEAEEDADTPAPPPHIATKQGGGIHDEKEFDADVDWVALPTLGALLGAVLDMGTHRHFALRCQAIRLFCRLTNYPGELAATVAEVQLLTTTSSAQFYRDAKDFAGALAAHGTGLLEPRAAVATLDRLDGLLASPLGGALHDKIAMLRHLQVPQTVLALLRSVDAPPQRDAQAFARAACATLQVLSQDAAVAAVVAGDTDTLMPLAPFNVDVLPLLRSVFTLAPRLAAAIPADAVKDVVGCLAASHSTVAAVTLLQDVLVAAKDAFGRTSQQLQDLVWRALAASFCAQGLLRFKHRWAGKRGVPHRERVLRSPADYFNTLGALRVHLEVARLVHVVMGRNQLTRHEEVRQELFGASAVADLLEIGAGRRYGAYYRLPFLQLLLSLVVEDKDARPTLVASRDLPVLLRACAADVRSLRVALGDATGELQAADFDDLATALAHPGTPPMLAALQPQPSMGSTSDMARGSGTGPPALPGLAHQSSLQLLRLGGPSGIPGGCPADSPAFQAPDTPAPRDEVEAALEAERSGIAARAALVVQGVIPLVSALAETLADDLEAVRLSDGRAGAAAAALNTLVDEVCEVVRFCRVRHSGEPLPADLGSDATRRAFALVLQRCRGAGSRGTARWEADVDLVIEMAAADGVLPVASAEHRDAPSMPFSPAEDDPIFGGGVNSDAVSAMGATASLPGTATGPGADEDAEPSVAQRWARYSRQQVAECPALHDDNAFASAAGFIMRSGPRGAAFLQAAVSILFDLPSESKVPVLRVLRQVMLLHAGHPFDDSPLAACHAAGLSQLAAAKAGVVVTGTPLPMRQNIVAAWGSPMPVGPTRQATAAMPNVVNIVCHGTHDQMMTAADCAIALTVGGNKAMQKTLMAFFASRADEEIFVFLRNRFALLRDIIRIHHLTGGSPAQYAQELSAGQSLLRLCQLFCEGHNAEMQNYLRQQPDNQVSVNVLESLAQLLDALIDALCVPLLDALMQTLATLAETVQGPCRGNQEALVSLGIGGALARLLSVTAADLQIGATGGVAAAAMSDSCGGVEADPRMEAVVRAMHEMAVTVLLALLEGHTDAPFIAPLLRTLSLEALAEAMDRSHAEFVVAKKHRIGRLVLGRKRGNDLQDELTVGVQIFIFFKMVLDAQGNASSRASDGEASELLDRDGVTARAALRASTSHRFINDKVATIEIARNGEVESVYFRIPAVSVENLWDSAKEDLIKHVARDSDTVRLLDFFERSQKLIVQLEHFDRLRRTPFMTVLHHYSKWLDHLSLFLAVGMNMFMLATIAAPVDLYSQYQTYHAWFATRTMGVAQIVLQTVLFINFVFGAMRVFLRSNWLTWQDKENERAVQEARRNLNVEPADIRYDRVDAIRWTPFFFISCARWLLRYEVAYLRVIFLAAAYLGFFNSPIWYSVQLLQIVQVFSALYNVVLAVTRNGWTLFLTFSLQLIVIYIFAMIAFYHYAGALVDTTDNFSCHTLAQCLVIMANNGLRMGGGIAEELPNPNYHVSYGRLFFDVFFFLIVVVIFLNIVFGIIVDTFAELRERRQFIDQDQVSKCFICGIADNEFDRATPGGFRHHVKHEHNMWGYMFFLHYIRLKPVEQLNGAEHYVRALTLQNETAFFPIGRAVVLDRQAQAASSAMAAAAALADDAGAAAGAVPNSSGPALTTLGHGVGAAYPAPAAAAQAPHHHAAGAPVAAAYAGLQGSNLPGRGPPTSVGAGVQSPPTPPTGSQPPGLPPRGTIASFSLTSRQGLDGRQLSGPFSGMGAGGPLGGARSSFVVADYAGGPGAVEQRLQTLHDGINRLISRVGRAADLQALSERASHTGDLDR